MSTTVAAKIAEIRAEMDVPSTVTDAIMLKWVNQLECGLYSILKTYKNYYYARTKDLMLYSLPSGVIWDDVTNIHIKDSSGEFQEAKKIYNRNYKDSDNYYWIDNGNLYVPAPENTDKSYLGGNIINTSTTISVSSMTSNSITTTDVIDFTDSYDDNYFMPGMYVTVETRTGINNGQYVITAVTADTLTFDADLTVETDFSNAVYTIKGCSADLNYGIVNVTGITVNDLVAVQKSDNTYSYYSKLIYIKEIDLQTVLSFPYSSLGATTYEVYPDIFNPGIRLTYKAKPTKKLIANISTDTLLLTDQWEEAYDYFLFAKIHEELKEYSDAQYKFTKSAEIIEDFKSQYKDNEENYPADNQIVAEW